MKKRNIDFFCPRWGSEHLAWEDFFIQVKLAGYDGVEWAISREVSKKELDTVFNLAQQYKVKILAQHYDTNESDFFEHMDFYSAWLEKIAPYPIVKLNSQTGKDFFLYAENKTLIDLANDFGRKHNISVCHETHRGKFSFATHITDHYLQAIADLKLTLDASHWVCVAESYLQDQKTAMKLILARTGHIHARVGHTQGPQVTNPASRQWTEALDTHLGWWDQAIAHQLSSEDKDPITITPEFGPYPYMVRLPNGRDIAGQWDINCWMMELLHKRYC